MLRGPSLAPKYQIGTYTGRRTLQLPQRALLPGPAALARGLWSPWQQAGSSITTQDVQRPKEGPFISVYLLGSVDSGLFSYGIPKDSSPLLRDVGGEWWGRTTGKERGQPWQVLGSKQDLSISVPT